MLSIYARFIVQRYYLVLFTVSVLSTVVTLVPLLCHTSPTFTDPELGFETRGTTLAHRFIAWENLIDESRPSKSLAVNPQDIEDQIRFNKTFYNRTRPDSTRSGKPRPSKGKGYKKKNKTKLNSTSYEKARFNSSEFNESNGHVHWGYGKNVTFENENSIYIKDHTRKQWKSLKDMRREPDKPLDLSFGGCGSPSLDNAHLVVTTLDNTSLLTFDNVMRMCKLQTLLVDMGRHEYNKFCQRVLHSDDACCPAWSIPNYIALISHRNSCENITEDDVIKTVDILRGCAQHFHDFTLMASCDLGRCNVPLYCSQYDAIYNLLFYLIDAEAFSPPDFSETFVRNSVIFLPLPSSRSILPYYLRLQNTNMSYDTLVIPAVEFGLKNALFDLWIMEDMWLIGLGGVFVFLCVLMYTKSILLTLLLFVAITFSLGISYFLYIYVYNLEFFPFMNLLVVVVVIGIGADDAFLYVKVWRSVSKQLIVDNIGQDNELTDIKNIHSAGETILTQIIEETLRHSVTTIFITTFTTAVAFFASYVSHIPAINCFSVFAGTAVVINFVLMITWLPASVFIIEVKLCKSKTEMCNFIYKPLHEIWEELRLLLSRFIITCVTKLNILFVLVLGAIGIYSIVVVFYIPGLRLPDSREFQLFQTSHPFESYEMHYRERFWFDRFSKDIGTGSKMPLRWIWGVKALDNGNHMDPMSKGHIVFDDTFSISDPKAQEWLLKFCTRLKAQPFYQHTRGPMLPNCFIENFKIYMSRRCIDDEDEKPCCGISKFPYDRKVFDICIIRAIKSLYQTPRELFIRGVAGPKFLRSSNPKVVAMVVEFESVVSYTMSYTTMNNFYLHVENWTQQELLTAPPSMRGGWFLSDLQFYDLQGTLARGTVIALILSALLGFLVLIPSTLNIVVSICAVTAMIFSCTVTIAILVLNNWKLNILESVAISTSAGLAVDFSLHYTLSYTNACGSKSARVKTSLSTSAGPTAAAALTSGFAGIFLLRSNLLPYSQIGTFLALIMSVSWFYATFFLCSLLFIFGKKSTKDALTEERKTVSRVSSICSGLPNLESHELEHLADSNRTNLTHSQSPSSISATTVVLHDDFENSHAKVEVKTSLNGRIHDEAKIRDGISTVQVERTDSY